MPAASSLFGDPAAIRCERAVAELRAGRPVLLHDGQGQRLAVIALDSATPAASPPSPLPPASAITCS
jgi:GTP cyclohydrolase II